MALLIVMVSTFSACQNAADNSKNPVSDSTGKKSETIGGALEESAKALAGNPASAQSYAAQGAVKYATGNIPGAIADLTKAIELDPESATAWSGRATAKFSSGDIAGATSDFLTAARLLLFSKPADK